MLNVHLHRLAPEGRAPVLKLGLATAAGGVFIWSCVQTSIAWEGKILLFSLCLILLGHASPLMLLLDRLPKFSGLSKHS